MIEGEIIEMAVAKKQETVSGARVLTGRKLHAGFALLKGALGALAFLLMVSGSALAVLGPDGSTGKPFVIKGMLEVQLTPDVRVSSTTRSFGRVSSGVAALDAVFTRHHVSDMRPTFPWRSEDSPYEADQKMSRFQRLTIPEDADMDLLINELLQTGKVITAEKIMAQPLLEVTPDDPRWTDQYAPALIGADATWDTEPGSDTVKIAICDSGVNYKHEDLINMIWVNPGEDIDGDEEVYDTDDLNGIDDDGNGVVDDLIGYDFFNGLSLPLWPGEDGPPRDTDPNDFDGHGTHVAGIAAAATNNALGVAGIAGGWQSGTVFSTRGPRIMCLRIGASANDGGQQRGFVNLSDAAAAIDYAAKNGADVVNCSWGSSNLSSLAQALDLANDSGVVISKAAGNDGADAPDFMGLRPDVMAVASVDNNDSKSGFSNFGTWIEISAPGGGIWSTFSSAYVPTYGNLSGTSMAAPAYVGAVALLKSLRPDFTKIEIDSILMATAQNIDAQNPSFIGQLGAGRVDIFNAIQNQPVALFTGGPTLVGNPGLSVDFMDLSPNAPTAWNWTFGDGATSTVQNPSHTYTDTGLYDVTLTVTEPNGTGFEQAKRMVMIHADTVGGDTAEGMIGGEVIVPVRLHNTFQTKNLIIPLKYADANGGSLEFSQVSTTGLVTEDWEFVQLTTINPFGKEIVIDMRSNIGLLTNGHSTYLPPGDNVVVNVHFNFTAGTSGGAIVPIITKTISTQSMSVGTIHGAIAPAYDTMFAKVATCCDTPGDFDDSGAFNIADVTAGIAFIFSSGAPPACQDEADSDGSNTFNIGDVTYGIAHIFSGGPAPICGSTGL